MDPNPQTLTKLFREKLLNRLLLIISLIALPIGFLSVYRVYLFGWKPLFVFQVCIAATFILLYLFRKYLSYNFITTILIIIFFILGAISLFTWGLMGMGAFIIILDVILTSFLLGFKQSYILFILEALLLTVLAFLVHKKWIQFNFDFYVFAYSGLNWISSIVTFLGFGSIILTVSNAIYKNLENINDKLYKSEERYNLALESVNDALYDYSIVTNQIFLSPRYYLMLGYDVHEFDKSYETWKKLIHVLDIENTEKELKSHLSGKTQSFSAEYRMRTKQGEWRWMLDRGRVTARDDKNRPLRMIGTHTDITNQKESLRQLQLTNTLLELAHKITKTGYYRYHLQSGELSWSKELYLIYQRDSRIQPPSDEEHSGIMAEGDWQRTRKLKINACKSGEQVITEYSIICPDGSKRNLLLILDWEKDEDGNIIAQIGTVQDITERKQFEKRIFDVIIETEEKERNSLAGNLHDDVGPLLSSLNMYLSMVSREDCANREEILLCMDKIVKDTIIAIREISNNLSPQLLSNYGMVMALKDFISSKKDLISIEFNNNIENSRFDSNIEATFYRIIKELINNTLKYAKARNIKIDITLEHLLLKLIYEDNGIGFKLDKHTDFKHHGIGLLNIVSRVKAINGQHRFDSIPGAGFLFELSVEINK